MPSHQSLARADAETALQADIEYRVSITPGQPPLLRREGDAAACWVEI